MSRENIVALDKPAPADRHDTHVASNMILRMVVLSDVLYAAAHSPSERSS